MFSWTELMLGNAVTRNDAYPMTVNLLVTIGSWSHGVMYSQSAAAGFVSMIPGIVVLFFVRTQIARGFMLGGRPGE
jgi:glycerol transport system permease protein